MELNLISVLISVFIPFMVVYLFHLLKLSKYLSGHEEGFRWNTSKQGVRNVLLMVLASLLLSFFLFQFCNDIGQEGKYDTFAHGAWHGAFAVIFVVLPVILVQGVIRGVSLKAMLVQWLFWLVVLALMGGVMDAMNHLPNQPVM